MLVGKAIGKGRDTHRGCEGLEGCSELHCGGIVIGARSQSRILKVEFTVHGPLGCICFSALLRNILARSPPPLRFIPLHTHTSTGSQTFDRTEPVEQVNPLENGEV